MDIRMPDVDGLTTTEMISADPDLSGVKILILTTFEDASTSPGRCARAPAVSSAKAPTRPTCSGPSAPKDPSAARKSTTAASAGSRSP